MRAGPIRRATLAVGALHWANCHRVRHGRRPLAKLPRGRRCDERQCVLARATGLVVYVPGLARLDGAPAGFLPDSVSTFALAFDAGLYPHLEDRA